MPDKLSAMFSGHYLLYILTGFTYYILPLSNEIQPQTMIGADMMF